MLSTLISGLSLSSSQQLSKVVKSLCIQGNSKRGRHGEVADQVLKPCLTLDLHRGSSQTWPNMPPALFPQPFQSKSRSMEDVAAQRARQLRPAEAAPGVLFPSWRGLGVLPDKSAAPRYAISRQPEGVSASTNAGVPAAARLLVAGGFIVIYWGFFISPWSAINIFIPPE